MPRGRVITADFWTDEAIIGLSPFARLMYIGLWNFAYCDKGHLPDEALGLKLKILPNDQIDPRQVMAELEAAGRVARVEAPNGKTFLVMPSFEKHQKKDERWKTRCPACALGDSLKLTETQTSFDEPAETHQNSALREENRKELNRREPERTSSPAATDPDLTSLFTSAWSHWPKKVERKEALARFKQAIKKIHPDELAYAIATFGDAYAETTERQFVPALGAWLNGERWTDELPRRAEPERKTSNAQRALSVVEHFARQEQGALGA